MSELTDASSIIQYARGTYDLVVLWMRVEFTAIGTSARRSSPMRSCW